MVTTTTALTDAVDALEFDADITRLGPSERLAADVVAATSCDRPTRPKRPVVVAATTDSLLSVLPLVATLRRALGANHVAIALTDPDRDVDIIWGHVFDAGLLVHRSTSSTGEPALIDQISDITGDAVSLAPLRVVRDGPEMLRSALTYEASTGHAYTLIDGADRADLTTVARATTDRLLTVGTPALIGELLHDADRRR